MAPAGAMLAMRPRDLLTFAKLHLDGGTAADGTAVLSAASAKAMQEPQVKVPGARHDGRLVGARLGAVRLAGTTVIGHDGGTIGQNAFLRVVPEHGLAIAVLTNGGDTIELYRDCLRPHRQGARRTGPARAAHSTGHGRTRSTPSGSSGPTPARSLDLTVRQDEDGRVWLDQVPKGIFAELGPAPEPVELVGRDEQSLIARQGRERGAHAARLPRRRRHRPRPVPAQRPRPPPRHWPESMEAS